MPHENAYRLSNARRIASWIALYSLLFGCSRGSEPRRNTDSAASAKHTPSRTEPALQGPLRDSLTLYYAIADSGDSLDARFQRARTDLNATARTLSLGDRRSRDYATRYAAFQRRAKAANLERAARDRLRARRDTLHAWLGKRLPASLSYLLNTKEKL